MTVASSASGLPVALDPAASMQPGEDAVAGRAVVEDDHVPATAHRRATADAERISSST